MNIVTTTTTKTTQSVQVTATVKDDSGAHIATMTGVIDAARPLGTTSLTVANQARYAANIDGVKEAYAAFQETMAEAAESVTVSSTSVESDGDEDEDTATEDESGADTATEEV
ncbi:MAG: hypothetical protein LUH36_00850 [Oscillospiraceae bacterium]|nr:hypothetical protein [Oscillospiraceae bacterium]